MSADLTLSFARDIRPMFTEMDVDHMEPFGIVLSDRDSVAENADAIYASVSQKVMPPKNSGEPQWTDDMCERFKTWQSQGCPP